MALPIETATIIGFTYDRARRQYEQHGILNHKVGASKISAARIDTLHESNKADLINAKQLKAVRYAIYDSDTHQLTLNQNYDQRQAILKQAVDGDKLKLKYLVLTSSNFIKSWDSMSGRTTVYDYDALEFGKLRLIKINSNSLAANGMVAAEEEEDDSVPSSKTEGNPAEIKTPEKAPPAQALIKTVKKTRTELKEEARLNKFSPPKNK